MMELIKEQRERTPKICEIFRFLIVGGIATIIDMFVMGLFVFITNKSSFSTFFDVFTSSVNISNWIIILATAIGFIVGLVFNYVFSIIYVYDYESKNAKTKKGFVQFGILSAIGLLIQTLGMFVLYSLLGVNEWIAKIILVLIVLVFNYITRKIFVFKNNKQDYCINKQVVENKVTTKALIFNILFTISSFFLCLFFYNESVYGVVNPITNYIKYTSALISMFLVGFYLFFMNKKALEKIKIKPNTIKTIIAYFFTFVMLFNNLKYTGFSIVKLIIGIASSFAIFCYLSTIINFVVKFIKNFYIECDDFRKKLLKYIFIYLLIFSVIVFFTTKIFSCVKGFGDIFFSFDSGFLVTANFHKNLLYTENDIRHFLLSLTILPFGILTNIFSNVSINAFILMICQILIVDYCIVTLIKYIQNKDKKILTLLVLFFVLSASTYLNVLTVEKFVFSLFYIITTIDYTFKKSPLKWVFFVGAVGILTTNVFLLPILLFIDKKPMKEWFAELMVSAISFVLILIMLGQVNLLLFVKHSIESMKRFSSITENISILNCAKQYLVFIATTILSPEKVCTGKMFQASPSILFCLIGLVILVINVISFIINRKDKFTQIAFYWQIFMFILLVLFGWGSALNEMFIYSAIFGWSSIVLVFNFVDKIIKNNQTKKIVLITLISVVAVYNIIEFIDILSFGYKYYPMFI